MPDAQTLIGRITLTTTQTSISFTNIPATYRDLRLVVAAGGLNDDLLIQFNGDGGSNYSRVYMFAQSSGAVSGTGGTTFISAGYIGSTMTPFTLDVLDYSATDKHKPTLSRSSDTAVVGGVAGRWASTSIVTSITAYRAGSNSFAVGNTFSLYGIAG